MKTILTSVLLFIFGATFSQSLDDSKKLIENKQYNSALLILNKLDPENANPEIVLEKTDIMLKYFVTSMMHQMFALKDLEEHEELMKVRGSEGSFSIYAFPIDSILNGLIKQHPNNFKLRKQLGYFYHEVHLKYGGHWLEDDSLVLSRVLENYEMAYKNGEADYWSLYGIAYCYLNQNKAKEAILYFEKSIKLNKDYPSNYYNLAYAYMSINEKDKGIQNAKKAYELYEYPDYKSDAAKMIGLIYSDMNDNENALLYLKKALEITPDNYYVLQPLLALEVKTNSADYKSRTKQFQMLAPSNPTIYQNLEEIYWNNEKENELMSFLEDQKKNFSSNPKVLGNLYFYIARIFDGKKDTEKAKLNFEKAKSIFIKAYDANHRVFEVIDSYLNEK